LSREENAMRIRNNRRIKIEFSLLMAFVLGVAILIIIWDFLSSEPQRGFGFWMAIIFLIFMPVILFVPYHLLTAKEVVIEEHGVAEYKKGKLIKLIKYEEIQVINVRRIDIFVNGTRKSDYPYNDVTSALGILFRLLFSSKFRKRFDEDRIIFKNHKKGFKEVELSFIIEIAKRSNCKIALFDNYLTEENTDIINNALKKDNKTNESN